MHILWIATKAPWPPLDGGRLVQLLTLEALVRAGLEVTCVAPVDPRQFDLTEVARELSGFCHPELVAARPRPLLASLMRAAVTGGPLTRARHTLARVRSRVEELLSAQSFDRVHVEQLQAWPQAAPARARGLPVVLRAQNVESDLWRAAAARLPFPRNRLARWEGSRLLHWEGQVVKAAAATVALTREDGLQLQALAAGSGRVEHVSAPFPEHLPPGEQPLPGDPALVLLGSGGWLPNRDATEWCLGELWPPVATALPEAVLHVFGEWPGPRQEGRVISHPAPADSREAYAPGSTLVVPLRFASGVRMKILEAWARGVPVVATPEAAQGLEAEDGRELLLARDRRSFQHAIVRIHREPGLRRRLLEEGRRALRHRHAPTAVGAEWVQLYRSLGERGASQEGRGFRPP